MKTPEFLTLAEVMDIHRDSLDRYGGQDGTRDLGLLESALAIPLAGFGGKFLHEDLFEMAAAYAYHIAENQPFMDGNKRTALGSALTFLDMNGVVLHEQNDQLYDAMIQISAHQLTKNQLAHLLRKLSQ